MHLSKVTYPQSAVYKWVQISCMGQLFVNFHSKLFFVFVSCVVKNINFLFQEHIFLEYYSILVNIPTHNYVIFNFFFCKNKIYSQHFEIFSLKTQKHESHLKATFRSVFNLHEAFFLSSNFSTVILIFSKNVQLIFSFLCHSKPCLPSSTAYSDF